MSEIPDHYARYSCNECGSITATAERAEDDCGVWCLECGSEDWEKLSK